MYDVPQSFCDDAWHTLYVAKHIKVGTIAVDGLAPQSIDVGGGYTAVGYTDPLTIGGRGTYYTGHNC